MADNAALFLGAGLLAGAGKGIADLYVEEARTRKAETLERLRSENDAKREADRDARLAKREADRDARNANDPLRQAQTEYYRSQADYNRAGRPRGGATMLKIGADTGRIYATDHEGPGDNEEAVVTVSSTDALRLKAVQNNNETKVQIARLGGDSRERVATTRADASRDTANTAAAARRDVAQTAATARGSARSYAPDQITKLRTARDALPDDHPDRDLYNEALKGIAQGRGTLSDAKIAEIKQRTLKDVQTATDARGKSLYATPADQQAEYERRLKLVLPDPAATPSPRRPAPAAAAPAPEPAAAPAPAAPAAPGGEITLKGAGTRDDPYIATTQAEIDHFRKTAPAGAVIVVNGKKYVK